MSIPRNLALLAENITSGGVLNTTGGGTGTTTLTGTGNLVLSNNPVLVAPALGTPASGVATNLTGLPLTTGVTGTLAVSNGGTGANTLTGYVYGNGTGAVTASTTISGANITGNIPGNAANVTGTVAVLNGGTGVTTSTGTGSVVLATSPTLVTPALGTPSSGTATNLTGLPLSTGVTGTLGIANGGTGATTASAALTAMSFVASGTGAVARTATSKLSDWVSVLDYGADPTGSSDSASAINAAITASSGIVYFPAGTYKINSGISWTKNGITLIGNGASSTIINANFTTGDIISVGDGTANPVGNGITELQITCAAVHTSGAAIRFRNGHNCWIDHVNFGSNQSINIQFDGGTSQFIYRASNIEINGGSYGIILGSDGTLVQNTWVSDAVIYGCTSNGILLLNNSGTYWSRIDIGSGSGIGFATYPATGKVVEATYCTDVWCDSMANGGWSIITNGGNVTEFYVTKGWASSCGNGTNANGILIGPGSGIVNDVDLDCFTSHANYGDGIYVNGGTNVTIRSPKINNNSFGSAGTFHGIAIANSTSYWQIIAGYSSLGGYYAANKQGYGVFIGTGCTNYLIEGVNCSSNTTGSISDNSAAASGVIRDCFGFVTKNSGTSTVAVGQTVASITHGLSFTPNAQDIIVGFTTAPSNSGVSSLYVTSITSTTFQIVTNTAVVTNAVGVNWQVRSRGA
jgi:hypothetical protein